MLGESLLESSTIPVQCNLFSSSDQESTSGEEDVLGNYFSYTLKTFARVRS